MEGQRVKRRHQGNVIVSICTPSPHKSCISTQDFDNDGIHISTGDCEECKCSIEVEKMKVDLAERFNILEAKLENILSVINIKSGNHGDAMSKGYSDDVASANDVQPLSEQNGIPYDGDVELTQDMGPKVIKKQKSHCCLGEIDPLHHGTQNDDREKKICSTQDNNARKPVNEQKEDNVAESTGFGGGLRNDSEENFGYHDDDLNSVEKRVGAIIDDLHKRIVTLDKKGEGDNGFLIGTSESSVGWTDIKAFNSMKAETMIADKDGARGGESMVDGLDSLFTYSRCTPKLSKLDELAPKKLKKVKKALFQHMEHCERVDGLMGRNGEKSMESDEVSGGKRSTSLQILDAMTGKWVPVKGAKVEGSPASLTIRRKEFSLRGECAILKKIIKDPVTPASNRTKDAKKHHVKLQTSPGGDMKALVDTFLNDLRPLSENEENMVMVKFDGVFATVKEMRCLKRGMWLNDTVIDLVVNLCNEESRHDVPSMSRLYMPTKFSSWILAGCATIREMVKTYRVGDRVLSNFENSEKIYIPMHEINHWYLIVIDFNVRMVLVFDSQPAIQDQISISRRAQIMRVVEVLQGLVSDPLFRAGPHDFGDITQYPIEAPLQVPMQQNLYDCGMFTIKFMMDIHRFSYQLVRVHESCRSELASMLICHPNNLERTFAMDLIKEAVGKCG